MCNMEYEGRVGKHSVLWHSLSPRCAISANAPSRKYNLLKLQLHVSLIHFDDASVWGEAQQGRDRITDHLYVNLGFTVTRLRWRGQTQPQISRHNMISSTNLVSYARKCSQCVLVKISKFRLLCIYYCTIKQTAWRQSVQHYSSEENHSLLLRWLVINTWYSFCCWKTRTYK